MNPNNMQMMLIVLTVLVVFASGIHARKILPDYAPTMDSSSSTNSVYSVKELVCKWLTRLTNNNSADNIITLCDKKGIIVISSPDLGKTKAPAPPPPKPSPGSRPLVAYS